MAGTASKAQFDLAVKQFSSWEWRLSNLYYIVDKSAKPVKFEMNWAQESFFRQMHYANVILKARQLGFTTFLQLFMLDQCVFNSDIRAGTIAHTLDDATVIFRDKVKYPYDRLPDQIRAAVPIVESNKTELRLGNNSSIRVGVSLRSGTLQYLHISEYGKICAKYPEKAREVRTGALNTVQAGQVIFIESTAEGQEGHFYDICEAAKSKQRLGSKLTPLDYKFHFYPWWKAPEYRLDPSEVVITEEFQKYFDGLKAGGIMLDAEQRAWYVKKAEQQLEDIKREYPSTPDEAFEASVEGAYYAKQMAEAELQGRIGDVPYDPNYPVNTAWDIGRDMTSIWFFQLVPGAVNLIHFYQRSGEVMTTHLDELERIAVERGWFSDGAHGRVWNYGSHYLPHDIRVIEWGGNDNQRIQNMLIEVKRRGMGRDVVKVLDHKIDDRIHATRILLGLCNIDQVHCADGIKALKNYRKEWLEEYGVWSRIPRHDVYSHGADAGGYLAMIWRDVEIEPVAEPIGYDPRGKPVMPKQLPKFLHQMTMDEYHKAIKVGGAAKARI